ncbi:MAG TPA: hypothetical protein VFD63_16805 [Pyrinomonadaceae bacterium]|nr:hypothetical protein [Pyrinomonadaceae bacterium]
MSAPRARRTPNSIVAIFGGTAFTLKFKNPAVGKGGRAANIRTLFTRT